MVAARSTTQLRPNYAGDGNNSYPDKENLLPAAIIVLSRNINDYGALKISIKEGELSFPAIVQYDYK